MVVLMNTATAAYKLPQSQAYPPVNNKVSTSDYKPRRLKAPSKCIEMNIIYYDGLKLNTYKGGGGVIFLTFFLDDKTSAPKVFCSCSFIPRAHFETRLVMVGYYGYTFSPWARAEKWQFTKLQGRTLK